MRDKKVTCSRCGKEIGVEVYDGGINSPVGFIPCYHYKMDYRKAARVAVTKGGHICKSCARKVFPDGLCYSVDFKYHGTPMSISGDTQGIMLRFTKERAEIECRQMNDKKNGTKYWVTEHKI